MLRWWFVTDYINYNHSHMYTDIERIVNMFFGQEKKKTVFPTLTVMQMDIAGGRELTEARPQRFGRCADQSSDWREWWGGHSGV